MTQYGTNALSMLIFLRNRTHYILTCSYRDIGIDQESSRSSDCINSEIIIGERFEPTTANEARDQLRYYSDSI